MIVGSFSASFILLEKMSRSSSISVKPAGGALRLEAWRMAGILHFSQVFLRWISSYRAGSGNLRIRMLGFWFGACGGVEVEREFISQPWGLGSGI